MTRQSAPDAAALKGAHRAVVVAAVMAVLVILAATGGLSATSAATPATTLLTWTSSTGTGPPALNDPAMAYDPDTATVVAFGGTLSDGSLSDQTWLWDGTWTEAAVGSAGAGGPPARTGASLAFDPAHHEFILFGGLGAGDVALDDTWAWNGESWVADDPAPGTVTGDVTTPPARLDAALAPDAAGDLVLFGGTTPAPSVAPITVPTTSVPTTPPAATVLDDTWTWDGTTWTPVVTVGAPPGRTAASLAFDPVHDQTVLFGGSPAPAGTAPAPAALADTWTWNGAAWSRAAPATSPPGRSAAVMVGDPSVGGAVLTGGAGAGGVLSDTWTWDGATWTGAATAGALTARAAAGGAYDTAASTTVVYGGVGSAGSPLSVTSLLTEAALPAAPTTTTTTTTVPVPGRPRAPSPHPVAGHGSAEVPTTSPAAPVPGGHATTRVATTVHPPRRPTSPPTTLAGGTRRVSSPPLGLRTPLPVQSSHTPRSVRPGTRVALAGDGFRPGAMVTITFHSVAQWIGTVTADADGRVSATVTVPPGAIPGDHHFEMSGPAPDGAVTTLLTAVVVIGGAHGRSTDHATSMVLVALAVLLPVGTWVGLGMWTRRHRRPATA